MFTTSLQAAIVSAILGNAILAAIFFYVWRTDRHERALGFWAVAYAASACRLVFRLASAHGRAEAIYGEALFGSLFIVFLALGTLEFVGSMPRYPWRTGTLALAAFGSVAALAAAGAIPLILPYLVAGTVYVLAGAALLRRGRDNPGVGYGLLGILFELFGGYVFAFSDLAAKPDDPKAYVIGPILNLSIGMLLLVVAQRKQQFAATRLTEALRQETADRSMLEVGARESEQRFRAILDSMRSLVGLLSPDGTVLEINRAALERAGIGREAVVGKPFWEMPWWAHDAEQQVRLREAIRRVAAGGYDRFESTHPAPDGSIGHFNFFLTPIRDAAGKVAYLVPEGHDITARKRVEQTLHAAEQRFRAISEGSLLGVFATDPAGHVTYLTQRASEITGVSEEQAIAGRWSDFIHPEDQQQQRNQWLQAMAERKSFVGDRRYVRHDGKIAWARVHVAPIVEGGELQGFVGTIEDDSARRLTEQALRDSEGKFSSFFSLTPEAIAVGLFPGGEYTEVNDAWCRLFGLGRDEVIGRTGLDLGLWEQADDRRRVYEELSRCGEIRNAEMRFRRHGGDVITTLSSAKVIRFGGNQRVLWNVHDLTAQRQLEAQHSEAEKALRKSEERLSRVFYLLPDLVTISSIDEGRFVDMNYQWESMLGYTREEGIGMSTTELGIWVDAEKRRQLIEDVQREGMVRQREITITRKDGRQLTCETSGSIFEWQGQNLLMLVTRDITAQRQMEMARSVAEQSLRVSQEMFSKAFLGSPDYITISRLSDGKLIETNEAFERFTGYSREEAIGRTSAELCIWVNTDAREQWAETLARRGFVRDYEALLAHRDGQWRVAMINASTIEIEGEECVIAIVREITEQRRMELALRESEEKFSTIFHQLPVAIAVTTKQDGRYIDINETWLDQFGYVREEVIGKTGAELNFWVDSDVRRKLAEYLAERPNFVRWEIEFRARDGRIVPTECSGRLFELSGEDVVIWSAPDIAERRRIEHALRESEEKFSAIFHLSPVALGVTSVPEGRYLDVNEAWTSQFGYSREDMIGKTSLDIGLWIDVAERTRLFNDVAEGSRVQNREVHFRRGDGTELLCELSGHVFELARQPVLIWSAHDVTEHRRVQQEIRDLNVQLEARVRERTVRLQTANEELAAAVEALKLAQDELVRSEKMAALGSLVAGVAHELNTPIGNSVTVASTLFEKTQDFSREAASGQVRRTSLESYLVSARTASELLMRSLSQANDLVSSFKQVAVDQTSAQRRRYDLKLVVEEVMATLAPILKPTPFKFELDISDKLVMDGFPGPLGQVITNLVTNSLAHGFEGRQQGLIRVAGKRSGKGSIELIFSDDGAGIPEADLKHIFNPFFTTKLGRGGSGLGLHIVYNIVTRTLGGRIHVSSQPGAGTSFRLLLPVVAPESGAREAFA
jgi:PAS domain S-box-containing protein